MCSRSLWLCRAFVIAGLAAGCGGGGDGPGIVNAPVVISVTVGQPSANPIDIGGTVQLNATVEVQNGAGQGVEWSSSSPSVATVNQSGLVTGVAGGSATITATSTVNRSRTGVVNITVNPPRVVSVTLNSGARSIRVAENFALTATVDVRGTLARTVTFSTSDASKATVSSTDGLTGTVVGVAAGSATIVATSTADATKNATIQVTITGTVRITSVTPSPANIRAGAQVKLVPVVQADAGLSSAVTYQSANAATATVAADGTVTGVAVGNTTVTVRSVADPTVSVGVPIIVRSGVTSVSLTPDRDSVRRGFTRQLNLSVVAETGVSTAVNLSSANSAIATIDASSRVTAVAIGQTYVRAISAVDPTVGDSTLFIVLDPCTFAPLAIGAVVSGVVNDLSCGAIQELYAVTLNSQTTYSIGTTVQFPAGFQIIGTKGGGYVTSPGAGTTATFAVIAAPGRYSVAVGAQNVSARGTFSLTTVLNPSLTGYCNLLATTGITVQVPLNTCAFAPQGRPAGAYQSISIQLLPFFQPGERLTLTITTPAPIFGLVEVHFGTNPTIQAIATGTTLVQTFTAPTATTATNVTFVVSTRDANQFGNVSVKVEGPPAISFDAFVFGSGVLPMNDRPALRGPRVQPQP